MKIFDSLSKTLKVLNEKKINIYNCGPTVYNDIHIGNARPLIVFDVLYRYLSRINRNVEYLHNLTDIDDKIINKAIEENTNEKNISEKYIDAYKQICKNLNIKQMELVKVTDHIDGIIDYIHRLILSNHAYEINGNVYFNIESITNYGSLSNKKIDELENGERVEIDNHKKHPGDFVLWKKTKKGIQWNTPWGWGRPGWHTECAYLIEKYFHNNLTIHGGGIDLKFPHHENENAQNLALYNTPLAKIWMHIGHVNINNRKMSKSLNNFVLVKDLLQTYNYSTIRWFFYTSNYSNPINFSKDALEITKKDINKIENILNIAKSQLIINDQFKINETINLKSFDEQLDANLNIVNAITCLQTTIKALNIAIRNKDFNQANHIFNQIINSLNVLGINFNNIHTPENLLLLKEYKQEITNKNFQKSDLIRKELIARGLI